MKSQFLKLADDLRGSYWFLPAVMALGAMLLAGGMILLDTHVGSGWMDGLNWLHAARPDGARQVLGAISGSMITVAGTVFSVTIAAVVYASGQYGARLLSNFMSDRGNQVTLGTFIATFVYCLLILRTIRSPGEGGDAYGFVPNLALLIGVALALCSIAVLIFFIHHVPSQLHINRVIEEIGARLLAQIGSRFPRFIGEPAPDGEDPAEPPVPTVFAEGGDTQDSPRPVGAKATGYIQLIDQDALMRQAREKDLTLRLHYQPGDFVHAGRTLIEAWPPDRCDENAQAAIRRAFGIGSRRTALQDLRFLIDELVEIAARALSPGINDPFTAVTCLDWLGAAVSELGRRELPSPLRLDEAGALRVIAHPTRFETIVERSFGALAPYCAADQVAALRFVRALGEASLGCEAVDRLSRLARQADHFEVLVAQSLPRESQTRVTERIAQLRKVLAQPDYARRLRDSAAWLGGAA